MIKQNKLLTGFVALFLLLAAAGCGVAMMSDERLARQSNAQFSQMKKKDSVSKNQGYQRMVEKIGKRITAVARVDVPGTEWEFVVFDKSEPNAFAMPGGKVGVNTGLIELANGDEDEIAAVIGHEVAHVAKRHSNKRMSQGVGVALGGILLETVRNTKVTKHAEGAAINIQPKHVKYPIPLNEVLTNPVLLDSDPTNNGYR